MIDKNDAPFGFYAVKRNGPHCYNCDLKTDFIPCGRCIGFIREDNESVKFKVRWWYKPILFIRRFKRKICSVK